MNHGYPDAYRCDSDGPFHSDERWRADRVIPKTPKSVWVQYGWAREGGWPSGEALLGFLRREKARRVANQTPGG